MKHLLFLFLSISIASCKTDQPHGAYYSANFNDYEHMVIDFWGTETIRIFGVKNGKLELSKGKWNTNSNDNLTIITTGNEVRDELMESANYFLQPFVKKDFEKYTSGDFNLEFEFLSTEELKHISSKKIFKAYKINN